MTITFDLDDAFGMTDLEALNYVPEDFHVVGSSLAVQVAMKRYGATVVMNGNEFNDFETFIAAHLKALNERGISVP